jgi:hypothetical protein
MKSLTTQLYIPRVTFPSSLYLADIKPENIGTLASRSIALLDLATVLV